MPEYVAPQSGSDVLLGAGKALESVFQAISGSHVTCERKVWLSEF